MDYRSPTCIPTSSVRVKPVTAWSQSPPKSASHLSSSIRLGVPVSNVSLEMWAPRDPVIEGGDLILLCSVAEGTGNITFSWHREDTGSSVGRKTQRSLSAELEVAAVQEGDAGRYYCRADNGHDPIQSRLLSIRVRSESVPGGTNGSWSVGLPRKSDCGHPSFQGREYKGGWTGIRKAQAENDE